MGLGSPTDLLHFTFSSPLEKLIWDSEILLNALDRLSAKAEGKSGTRDQRLNAMRKLRREKIERRKHLGSNPSH